MAAANVHLFLLSRNEGSLGHMGLLNICFWIELSLAMINAARVELKNSVIACYPHCLYISHVCLNNFSAFFLWSSFSFLINQFIR